jgi:hypothetical protein
MPCSKLEVSTAQHGTLSGAGYLHQSPGDQEQRHAHRGHTHDRNLFGNVAEVVDRRKHAAEQA